MKAFTREFKFTRQFQCENVRRHIVSSHSPEPARGLYIMTVINALMFGRQILISMGTQDHQSSQNFNTQATTVIRLMNW